MMVVQGCPAGTGPPRGVEIPTFVRLYIKEVITSVARAQRPRSHFCGGFSRSHSACPTRSFCSPARSLSRLSRRFGLTPLPFLAPHSKHSGQVLSTQLLYSSTRGGTSAFCCGGCRILKKLFDEGPQALPSCALSALSVCEAAAYSLSLARSLSNP